MMRFQSPVLQFLRHRRVGSDAEDLLQETFLRAYANLHRYNSKWRFATWMFTIARRVSINHNRRTRPVADDEIIRAAESGNPEPLETIIAEEDRQRLWDMAAKLLGQDELTAVWLFYVEEMSTREIATILERSRVSVKTMMFRSRRKLRTLLEEFESNVVPQQSVTSPKQKQSVCPEVEVSHG
jgi:RNA polymerase sigma-70 factor (ECF subfamily)